MEPIELLQKELEINIKALEKSKECFNLPFNDPRKKRGGGINMAMDTIILAIIIGTLAAIVYSLRILVLMERRIARIDMHMEAIVEKINREELKIEGEERKIEKMVKRR